MDHQQPPPLEADMEFCMGAPDMGAPDMADIVPADIGPDEYCEAELACPPRLRRRRPPETDAYESELGESMPTTEPPE